MAFSGMVGMRRERRRSGKTRRATPAQPVPRVTVRAANGAGSKCAMSQTTRLAPVRLGLGHSMPTRSTRCPAARSEPSSFSVIARVRACQAPSAACRSSSSIPGSIPARRSDRGRGRDRRRGHTRGRGEGEGELYRAVPQAGAGAEGEAHKQEAGGGVTTLRVNQPSLCHPQAAKPARPSRGSSKTCAEGQIPVWPRCANGLGARVRRVPLPPVCAMGPLYKS